MNDVLDDRLSDLFDRVASAFEVEEDLERAIGGAALERRRTSRRGRGWMAGAAAAAIAAAGTAGVLQLVDRKSESTVAEAPVGPGPLYVLPGDLGDWRATSGRVSPLRITQLSGVVIGRPDGDRWVDVASLIVDRGRHDVDAMDAVDFPSGPGFVSVEGLTTTIGQQRGDFWIGGSTFDNGRALRMIQAIDHSVIAPDGTLSLIPNSPLEIIDDFHVESGYDIAIASYELVDAGGDVVTIDTLSPSATGLLTFAAGVDSIARSDFNGATAWLVGRDNPDVPWYGVVWTADDTDFAVSGEVSVDTLLGLAEDLEVVDEATWSEATRAG